MQLNLRDGLAFISVAATYAGKTCVISDVIVDTGSATTMFSANQLAALDITPEPDDVLYTIKGVGGVEVVFSRKISCLQIDSCEVTDFEIEVGGMDYGFTINGILGMDFLLQTGAILDLEHLEISFAS
ncbi:MAG TPA: aspartyl protease family protein [Anaerolineae bacterium]|nr:aspartyl protease family protein [Anaerolineae bacterium]HQI84749.1 aspartyl protease family protein [Anaerolineae bacterium]